MGTRAIEEESSPPSIEGAPGEGGASTRAASGARQAPTLQIRATSYDANDDPTMTAIRWMNDVSSDDTVRRIETTRKEYGVDIMTGVETQANWDNVLTDRKLRRLVRDGRRYAVRSGAQSTLERV
ncbi:hypothetical protein THAOC_22938 [Thalassiosira oceanica]|uniref:Uncharacterized protein n=1 Tax=Thalassiosira oceanica TaxID=159749 RepID=K0RVP9_THAOC|nr:hypothetical protein THAOC_22938 [Thalassiosira oceanica]|eukprot:EJK57060.1 hypothetical protein THAOC_22938 [Thalassiosira oceanica]